MWITRQYNIKRRKISLNYNLTNTKANIFSLIKCKILQDRFQKHLDKHMKLEELSVDTIYVKGPIWMAKSNISEVFSFITTRVIFSTFVFNIVQLKKRPTNLLTICHQKWRNLSKRYRIFGHQIQFVSLEFLQSKNLFNFQKYTRTWN